ncbi:MAG: hypothetical protein K2Q45_00515 [Nitrosomonas sp.]|nr:hypothetical protein [Nitrosomonas sp.]
MLQAVLSVETITGDHDGYCSGGENEDSKGYMNHIPVRLSGDVVDGISHVCAERALYLVWLVDLLDFQFETYEVGTYGSGYCSPSPSGLHHEMSGIVEQVHWLEFSNRRAEYTCNVCWKEVAWRSCPRFIYDQLMALFLCAKRIGVSNEAFCKDIRKFIADILIRDWLSFVSDGNPNWLL